MTHIFWYGKIFVYFIYSAYELCIWTTFLFLLISFEFVDLLTCNRVFRCKGGGREGNTWPAQTGMKPRRFEKVQTSFPFEFSCFKNCLECYNYSSLPPQLRPYFWLFFIDTVKTMIWWVLLPVNDRLTECKGLMTSARSVCEDN